MTKRLVLVVLLCAFAGAYRPSAQAGPGLFVEAPPPPGAPGFQDRSVTRSRWVTVDFSLLREPVPAQPNGTARPQTLSLTLFDDVRGTAMLDRVEPTTTGYVWVGRLLEMPDGRVSLAVTDDALAGTIVIGLEVFTIRYVGGGIHVIQEVNQAALPPEAPPVEVPGPARPGAAGRAGLSAPVPAADDGSLIDVLVAYTPAARSLQGGTSSIQALIDLGISETNQAYANSGVTQRVRAVNKVEVAYTESGSMGTDLERLQDPSDGNLDEVLSLRDTYGADVVQLIENSPDACGIAYLMTTVDTGFAPYAVGITHYTCISPNYSFAHEMGHNMGLHHDVYVTGGATGAYPYSHGYVNQAAFGSVDTTKRWRDIMAYNNQCADNGFNCTRLQYFSNPANTYTGDPMGNAGTADAVTSLNNTRVTVSNFRTSVVPVVPGAFSKTLPTNGATAQSSSPTLSWGAASGATGYEYCIDTTNDNACGAWTGTGTNTSVGLSGLGINTTYYWHVRATNGGGATYADGSGSAFWSFGTGANAVLNGTFGAGITGWSTFAAPDPSYMESTIVNGVYQWRRVPQTPGQPVSQATIYQPTGVALGANVPVSASFDIGNTSSARKYMKVLLVGDANFTDLAACAFWLPPNAPLTTFQMRAHTTKAWTNATIYFYASSPNTDNGYYLLDNVSMAYGGVQAVDRTECIDPNVPAPPGGAAGPNLLTNGDFGTGVLAPFGTVGNVTTQISSNVLEFYRGAVFPPPVIQQATGQAMTANQLITATLELGNSSPVRKRVLILLNDNDFSDLTACTFWLEPGAALATYSLTGYASKAWTNATLSIYPSTQYDAGTPANNPWIRMDNLTLQRTPSAATTGTRCLEPGASDPILTLP